MACEHITEELNGKTYSTMQWSASKALCIQMKLAKYFGSCFGELAAALAEGEDFDPSSLIEKLLTGNDPDEIFSFLKSLVSTIAVNGGKKIGNDETLFNEHFSGAGLMDFYVAVFFILKANYKDFFSGKLAESLAKEEQVS